MPRTPATNPSIAGISEFLFSELAERLTTLTEQTYPLYVGDTWLQPPDASLMENLSVLDYPQMYRYAPSHGMPRFLKLISETMQYRMGVNVSPQNVIATVGATGAIASVVAGIVSPGDEFLILAPHWPLITGIIRSFSGIPVPVHFYGNADSAQSAVELVSDFLTPRTVGLYFSSPNNPTGHVLHRSWIEALIELAERNNLWVIADEAYEQYAYKHRHTHCHGISPERVFSIYSFSKTYGMAGNRCGYVVGPGHVMKHVRKANTHLSYGASVASQIAGYEALGVAGDRWIRKARELYVNLGNSCAAKLGVPEPEGGQYIFMDIRKELNRYGDIRGFLEACVSKGVLVTPGTFFGDYPTHIRVCFTSAPPEVVETGVDILSELLHGD